jgi:formylglycine-generating enzyme required for sulfatase activity
VVVNWLSRLDDHIFGFVERREQGALYPNLAWIPRGTFRWESDKHYPEERPVHRVSVDGFWMDRSPVTNERFARFVEATGSKTLAEIVPKVEDYRCGSPTKLFAGIARVRQAARSGRFFTTSATGGTGLGAPTGGTRTDPIAP